MLPAPSNGTSYIWSPNYPNNYDVNYQQVKSHLSTIKKIKVNFRNGDWNQQPGNLSHLNSQYSILRVFTLIAGAAAATGLKSMMVPLLSATVMKSMALLDPILDQSPATPSLSSSALMSMKVVTRGSWLQFAAQPVSPQMFSVSLISVELKIFDTMRCKNTLF